MTPDDIGRVASRSLFLSLEHIAAPRLIKFFYVLGLAAIALWAISHFFYAFAFGFAEGLWGIIEILVFGLLMITGLRIVCEAGIVFFKAHEPASSGRQAASGHASLMDEVRGAIEDLAGEDDDYDPPEPRRSSGPVRAAPARTSGDTTATVSAPLKGGVSASADPAVETSPAKSGAASKGGGRKAQACAAHRQAHAPCSQGFEQHQKPDFGHIGYASKTLTFARFAL